MIFAVIQASGIIVCLHFSCWLLCYDRFGEQNGFVEQLVGGINSFQVLIGSYQCRVAGDHNVTAGTQRIHTMRTVHTWLNIALKLMVTT